MQSPDLLAMCASAFVAVFLLLSLLAGVMKLVTAAFPSRTTETDDALIATVHSVVHAQYPGTKVVKIEEIQA